MKNKLFCNLIFVIILSITIISIIGCDNTGSDPSDPEDENDIIIAGYSSNSSNIPVPTYWINNIIIELPVIDSTKMGETQSLYFNGTTIYTAGSTLDSNNVQIPAYWTNTVRTDLTDLIHHGYVYSISVQGTDIYVAGLTTDIIESLWVPCYWENEIRYNLPGMSVAAATSGVARAIYVDNSSDIHIAGFSKTGANVMVPAYWLNGLRTDISVIDTAKNGYAESVFVIGTDIYITGYTVNSSNIAVPCYWRNGARTDISTLDPSYGSVTRSIIAVAP